MHGHEKYQELNRNKMDEHCKKITINNETAIEIVGKDIIELPKFDLSNLQLLYLGNNKLTGLPENFFKEAPVLKWLDVRNNCIETIPLSIKNHGHIRTILLQNNKITYLPVEMGTVKSLKYIQLSGNPIIYPKKSVIKSGTEAILKYLRLQYIQENTSDVKANENIIDVSLKQSDISANRTNECAEVKKRISIVELSSEDKPKVRIEKPKGNLYFNSNKYVKCERPMSKEEQTVLIYKNLLKDIWTEKKREILNRREKVLQDKKSLAALKNWRHNYRNAKPFEPNTFYALDLSHIPFDIDLNHVKILTRADIQKDLPDKYKRNVAGIKRSAKSAKVDVRSKIEQLAESFRSIQSENLECSPRTERKMIGRRIQKLTDIKNKIVKLKLDNDRSFECAHFEN